MERECWTESTLLERFKGIFIKGILRN